jgi:hypothetical protein
MPDGWLRDRGTFHRTGPSRTPLREPVAARCAGWPACAASARFHRCAKTPARPLLAPLSRDDSRPRAPLRLLQVDVSTSTTTDHSNIALRAVRGRDGCLGSIGSSLPIEAAAGVSRGQGPGQNQCPTFPAAITRAGNFAPTPIAPGTSCRETPPLAGLKRHGEVVALPTSSALTKNARRQNGITPGLHKEARR